MLASFRPVLRRLPLRQFATKRFTTDHEWVSVKGDVGTIGITDYAQKALGDVVFVDLPKPGKILTKKEAFAAVESVKAASDVYSPVSGKIVSVNSRLDGDPTLINSAAEGEGWLIKVQLSNESEVGELLDLPAYQKHCEDAAH